MFQLSMLASCAMSFVINVINFQKLSTTSLLLHLSISIINVFPIYLNLNFDFTSLLDFANAGSKTHPGS